MSTIYVPGKGRVDLGFLAADRKVKEYDERLYFERNQETGQYCIYLTTPADEPDLPILGFDEIPHVDDIIKRLWEADTMRHGEEILDGMHRRNKEALKPLEAKADDASGQAAEGLEILHRRSGTHPSPRIFVPNGVDNGRPSTS